MNNMSLIAIKSKGIINELCSFPQLYGSLSVHIFGFTACNFNFIPFIHCFLMSQAAAFSRKALINSQAVSVYFLFYLHYFYILFCFFYFTHWSLFWGVGEYYSDPAAFILHQFLTMLTGVQIGGVLFYKKDNTRHQYLCLNDFRSTNVHTSMFLHKTKKQSFNPQLPSEKSSLEIVWKRADICKKQTNKQTKTWQAMNHLSITIHHYLTFWAGFTRSQETV